MESINELSDAVMESFVSIPGKRWSLIQTRPRNEKYAMQGILEQGIIGYLPLITKVEIHNRSKRERFLPMFPGYLFACPDLPEETLIRRNKCVWNLKVLSEPEENSLLKDLRIVRECELLSRERKLVVNPQLCVGDTVQLKSGPFKKHDVIVVRRKAAACVVVNLDFLGRNIEIECDADDLIY